MLKGSLMKTFIVKSSIALLAFGLFSNIAVAAQDPAKSTNVRGTLIANCKESVTKAGKLNAAETDKFCTCQVNAEGNMTKAQEWQIISTINQKKSPATLPFVQQQQKALANCLGTALTGKLQTLAQQQAKR